MSLPAAPLFLLSLVVIVGGSMLVVRSIWAYERELFVFRMLCMTQALQKARGQGSVGDSPRLRHLIHTASMSSKTVEFITPARLETLVRMLGASTRSVERERAPKEDWMELDRQSRCLISAWVRLLMLGSPSGWLFLTWFGPGLVWRAVRSHIDVMRFFQEQVYERLVKPADVEWLKPVQPVRRQEPIPA